MKRLLPLVCVFMALTGCAASHKSAAPISVGPTVVPVRSVHATAAAREREAGRKAERLLRRVMLPPGTTRLLRPPTNYVLLNSGLGVSVATQFADRYAFWSVHSSLYSVDSFVKAHPPAGLKWGGSGSTGGPGAANISENFYSGQVEGRPTQRLLSITMDRLHGRTVIRIDAGAAWVYPRSPSEAVPAGVREIDITNSAASRRVTDSARVARIVHWFDALNIAQPGIGPVHCPLLLASKVTLTFRSASRAELAKAVAPSVPASGCNPIQFTIRGHRQTPLIDSTPGAGRAFMHRVQRLLSVRFAQRP